MVTEELTANPVEEQPSHVHQRAIVLERFRLFFVPVPKAGCTSILWSLAGLAGINERTFADSQGREVTRALAIHDMRRWPNAFVFAKHDEGDRERILSEDGWLRFSVVRDPFRRLWSAWQSKLLLAEPQFVERYLSESWFPRELESSKDVVAAWRDFVDALRNDPKLINVDVHWAPQVDLLEHPGLEYDHLGRVEQMQETVDRLHRHVHEVAGVEVPELIRTNLSTIPFTPELLTPEDVEMLGKLYSTDIERFGYQPPKGSTDDLPAEWSAAVDAVVPAIDELRSRHECVADMREALRSRREKLRDTQQTLWNEKRLRRELQRRNNRLRRRLRQTSKQLQNMQESRAWRYTAPLRRVGTKWRGVKKKLRGR